MRYLLLNLVVLLTVFAALRIFTRQKITKPLLIAIAVILCLTAVFDSFIIMSGIVGYNLDNILGIYIWRAPIEDFIYAIVSVLMVGMLWEYYDGKE